jgi:hypothetical protein
MLATYSLNISKLESEVITKLSLNTNCALNNVVDRFAVLLVPPIYWSNSCSPDRSV